MPKSASRPDAGKFTKVLVGGEGLQVALVRMGPEESNEFLLAINGIDHEWNGKIFKLTREGDEQSADYTTKIGGKDFGMLIVRNAWGYPSYEVHLKGWTTGVRVAYDEKLSRETPPEFILTKYLQSEKGGKKKAA